MKGEIMTQSIQDKFKQAVEDVLRCEEELEKAQQKYDDLVAQAYQQGIELPRTKLSNPFMRRT